MDKRHIDDSVYTALDITLSEGGLYSYTVSHINPATRFSSYLVGIADRESYCVPLQ